MENNGLRALDNQSAALVGCASKTPRQERYRSGRSLTKPLDRRSTPRDLKQLKAMPKLVFTGEHFTGRVYELTLEKTTVGRGDQNTLVLNHPSVSLAHCEILLHGPEVIVRDLGQVNGTYVNGHRLSHQQCQMKSGQVIQFGLVQARLDLGLPNSETTDVAETAVFDARRIARDQRREGNAPKPASASAKFGTSEGLDPGMATVVMPPIPSIQVSTPPAAQRPQASARKRAFRILFVAVLALAIVYALLLIWRPYMTR